MNILDEIDAVQEKPKTLLDDLLDKIDAVETRDPIDKINDNIKLKEDIAYHEKKELEKEDESTFYSETKRALGGGVRDAAQGVLNLQDTVSDALVKRIGYDFKFGDDDGNLELSDFVPTIKKLETEKDIEEATSDNPFILPEVDKNETVAGQIARDLTRFVVGTLTARFIRTKGLKVKDPEGAKSKFLVNVGDSILGSQLVSAGDEGRLSDILAEIPEIMEVPGVSDTIDALKSNPNDAEGKSRLKMAFEDAIVAFPIEIGVRAAKLLFKGAKDPIRKSLGDKIVKPAEDAISAKKASDDTIDLLEKSGNSKSLLPNPLFDEANISSTNFKIKFKNKQGKELFETVNDGVEDMVHKIFASNQDKIKLAKKMGTKAPNFKTKERAKRLGLGENNFEQFFKDAGIGTTAEYVTAARMLFIGSADKVQSIAKVVADGQGGTQAQGQLAKAVLRHRAIQEKLLSLKANAGRTLQAFNIPVGNNSSLRNKQIGELTAAVLEGDVTKLSKLAQDLATNTDEALGKLMKKKFTDSKTDLLNQLVYFNFLSSPSTYLVNTLGNAMTQVYETVIATPTAAVIGAIRSPFVKAPKDRVYFSEVFGRTMGTAASFLQGMKNFGKVIIDGDLPPELKRMSRSEYEEIIGTGGGKGAGIGRRLVGGTVRLPGKILLATDAFFKTLGKGAFVYQQAYRGAAKKGLIAGTKEHGDYVSNIINKTPAQLEKAALEDAARITFTKDNTIASQVAKLKRVPVIGNVTALYLPFVRTPLNLAGYSLTNSLFALANPAIIRGIRKGGAEADETIGRIIAGTGVISLGTYLASEGVISGTTGGYKEDIIKTQGLGYQDKAIRIGDKTYSYNRFDPFGSPIGFGADIYAIYKRLNAIKDTDRHADLEKYLFTALQMTGSSMWANLADKAMLTGIAQFAKDYDNLAKAVEGGTSTTEYALNKFSKQAARGFLTPNVLRLYGRTSDPFIRDTYTALDVIKDAIPFLREDLPIRYDMFGRMMYIEQYGEPGIFGEGVANDLMEVIGSISRVYSLKDDPFAQELVKLELGHTRPSRKMSITGFDGTRVELDLEQYTMLEGYTGAQYHQYGLELIQTRAYKKALPYEKKKMIAQIKNAASAYGRAMVLDSHGVELFKKAELNYFKDRRETPYWKYLPEHMKKTYVNQQPLPKNIGKDN